MTDGSESSALMSLLQVVQRDLQERRRKIFEQADEREGQIVRQARTNARQRVSRAVREERERIAEEVERSRTSHAIEARERRQQAARRMLEEAWGLLPEVLRERWREPEARRRWVKALVEQARASLGDGSWRVVHPPGFEPDSHPDAFGRPQNGDPTFEEDPEMEAGLRIYGDNAVLDGSIGGLLTDRRTVEGRLLAELMSEEGGP